MDVAVVRAGFGEWATARTPELLRLAYLVTGSRAGADDAVRRALARVESRWHAISRTEDPDRVARRVIVASRSGTVIEESGAVLQGSSYDVAWRGCLALPARQRAALVLSHFEGLESDRIADVLDCSEATVRSQLQRAATSLRAVLPPEAASTDDDLRRTLRETFRQRASAAPADVGARPEPADPVGGAPRRRTGWLAAVVVLALVMTISAITHATGSIAGVWHYTGVSIPKDWRYESYDGVQLRVPPAWGWGGAPVRGTFNNGRLGSCGANQAYARPGPASGYVPSTTPFVGRPAVLSTTCVSWGSYGVFPGVDAVWFDSPLPVGQQQIGQRVAETRDAGDQQVTVFSADPELRRQVLASVEQVDVDANGCPTRAVQRPAAGSARLHPASLSVCVYTQDTGSSALLWSARLGRSAARQYVAAFAAADRIGRPSSCSSVPHGAWVSLGIPDAVGGAERWDVLDLVCAQLVGGHSSAALSAADLRPWAGGGTTTYVAAPHGIDSRLTSYFRSPLD